ncbi:MAG: hypothetical protein Fur0028_13380 [Bacteroidales bacterium]
MSKRRGAPAVDARIVIGALIVKHLLVLDDEGTIEMIRKLRFSWDAFNEGKDLIKSVEAY